MIKVLFVCHGNICRSPMAEFLFKDLVKKEGLDSLFHIESRATSREEIGNGVHYGTKKILNSLGIDCSKKRACQITYNDYLEYDYILLMDSNNLYNLKRIVPNDKNKKVHLLLEYANLSRDISDPWYTGDFDKTYNDIMLGINAFLAYLKKNKLSI